MYILAIPRKSICFDVATLTPRQRQDLAKLAMAGRTGEGLLILQVALFGIPPQGASASDKKLWEGKKWFVATNGR